MNTEEILQTLYDGYYSLYLVNGKTGKYSVLHTKGMYKQYNQKINDFEGAIYDYACNYVNERDKDRVIAKTKLALVKEKLKTQRDVVVTYQMKDNNEWRSLNFIRTPNYENDELFLMGISVYNKEVQQYYSDNKLKDVISLISEEFQAIYRIDLARDKIESLFFKINSDYTVDSNVPYSYIEQDYRQNYVDRAFLAEMQKLTSRDALCKHFAVSDEPRIYHYKENNGHWYKMIMSKDREYTNEYPYIILAVKECDDDIRLQRSTIIGNLLLSKLFSFSALIDLNTNTYEIYHSENEFYKEEKTGKFDKLIEASRPYVYEEDYEYYRSLFNVEALRPNIFIERTFRAEDTSGMMHYYNAMISKIPFPDGYKLFFIVKNEDELEFNRTRYERLEKKHNTTQNMLYALGDMYYSMYYLNSETQRIEPLRTPKEIRNIAQNTPTYNNFFTEYANKLVHPDDKEKFCKYVSLDYINKELRKGKNTFSCEYMRLFDDEYRWVNLDIQVTASKDGQATEIVFAGKDIHEERNKEIQKHNELKEALLEAKIANEAKSSFLSNMSHDMRTPMNAILGMTDIALMHTDDKERILDSLSKIKISGKHLLQLIDEVLDMSYIESGKVVFKNGVVHLPELFHDIVYMLQKTISDKHLKFKARAINITNETVITDAVRLRQIFTNVLINSIKYTPEYGSIELVIEQCPKTSDVLSEYKITISDTGIGMSPEFLQKLYTPFERAMDTTQSGVEGIGLGMSITMKLIEALNGTIQVESEPNKGTRFEITIPMESSDEIIKSGTPINLSDYTIIYYEEEIKNFTEILRNAVQKGRVILIHSYDVNEHIKDIKELGIAKILPEPVFKSDLIESPTVQEELVNSDKRSLITDNKKILVADDNIINLSIVCDYLEDMGISFETVSNGKEAYEKIISDNSFDLILMDIRMPVMDGHEATRKIREHGHPYTDNIPIIAMTANAFEEDISMAKQSGMNEHMSKPIEFDKFASIIHNFLK